MVPQPNEIYKHFKGKLYRIVTLAIHTETKEEMVVYQALYGEYQIFVRPLAMFMEPVDREKYPKVQQKMRFERVEEIVLIENQPKQYENENALQNKMKDKKLSDIRSLQDKKESELKASKNECQEEKIEMKWKNSEEDIVSKEEVFPKDKENQSEIEYKQETQSLSEMENGKTEDGFSLDPMLEAFLDADDYGERLNILRRLEHRITDSMINTMAVVMDITIPEGNIQDRYDALKSCLLTLERYECNRLIY